jgi:hypothetical protein
MTREFTLPQNYTSENDSAESSLKSRAVKLLSTIISMPRMQGQHQRRIYDPICHLRTGSPWFDDVLASFIAFICAFAALPAADLSNSSCLRCAASAALARASFDSASSASARRSRSAPPPPKHAHCPIPSSSAVSAQLLLRSSSSSSGCLLRIRFDRVVAVDDFVFLCLR